MYDYWTVDIFLNIQAEGRGRRVGVQRIRKEMKQSKYG